MKKEIQQLTHVKTKVNPAENGYKDATVKKEQLLRRTVKIS